MRVQIESDSLNYQFGKADDLKEEVIMSQALPPVTEPDMMGSVGFMANGGPFCVDKFEMYPNTDVVPEVEEEEEEDEDEGSGDEV